MTRMIPGMVIRPGLPGKGGSAEDAARGVLASIRRAASQIHSQVYGDPRGLSPKDILAALGDKSQGVLDFLAAAENAVLPDGKKGA